MLTSVADRTEGSARGKVRTLAELEQVAEEARRRGETVVLAHGVFDLLHLGHVRYLEAARREGSVLIVTVTADAFVNKGPGRPAFGQELRAEMVAAVHCVDYVAVNNAPTATDVIRALRPNVYVKGAEYQDEAKDITGQISREREEVERQGGSLVFTNDIAFSSSSLLNRYFDTLKPEVREYVERVRGAGGADAIFRLVDAVKDYRVLLVGDTIVDDYRYVTPRGKTPKEHIVATQFRSGEVFAGGVIAAANHVAGFCAHVEVLTLLGEQDSYEDMIRASLRPNVSLTPVVRRGVPTVRKCRFVDSYYMRKMFEVHFMDDSPVASDLQAAIDDALRQRLKQFDVVIATDFGHGMIGASTVQTLAAAPFLAVNAQTNSSNFGFNLVTKFERADYVCIDATEARLASGNRYGDLDQFVTATLQPQLGRPKVIITDGRNGSTAYDREGGLSRMPAFTDTVVDTMGAGDAFLAVTSPLVAAGGDLDLIGFIGNAAGAIKVGIVGHRKSVEKTALLKYIDTMLK